MCIKFQRGNFNIELFNFIAYVSNKLLKIVVKVRKINRSKLAGVISKKIIIINFNSILFPIIFYWH